MKDNIEIELDEDTVNLSITRNGWYLEESRHYTSPGKYGIKLVKSRDGEGLVYRAIVFRNWSPEFRTEAAAHTWAHRFFDSCERGTA